MNQQEETVDENLLRKFYKIFKEESEKTNNNLPVYRSQTDDFSKSDARMSSTTSSL